MRHGSGLHIHFMWVTSLVHSLLQPQRNPTNQHIHCHSSHCLPWFYAQKLPSCRSIFLGPLPTAENFSVLRSLSICRSVIHRGTQQWCRGTLPKGRASEYSQRWAWNAGKPPNNWETNNPNLHKRTHELSKSNSAREFLLVKMVGQHPKSPNEHIQPKEPLSFLPKVRRLCLIPLVEAQLHSLMFLADVKGKMNIQEVYGQCGSMANCHCWKKKVFHTGGVYSNKIKSERRPVTQY